MTDSQSAALSVILDQLNTALTLTGEDLITMQEQFGVLWQDAEARADENAKAAIVTAWERAQNLANTSAEAARAATTAGTLATEAIQQRDAMFDQLQELETAVSDADTSNSLVADLVEYVEERTAESMSDQDMTFAYDEGFDEGIETVIDNLAQATGCRWSDCSRLIATINGMYGGLTDEDTGLLRPLINELSARIERELTANGAPGNRTYRAS